MFKLIGGMLFVLLLVAMCSTTPHSNGHDAGGLDSAEPCSNERMAYEMAKDFVKDTLKAPATADFADFDIAKIQKKDGCIYIIASYVDAQNSFGANIRSTFATSVVYEGDNKWKTLGTVMKP